MLAAENRCLRSKNRTLTQENGSLENKLHDAETAIGTLRRERAAKWDLMEQSTLIEGRKGSVGREEPTKDGAASEAREKQLVFERDLLQLQLNSANEKVGWVTRSEKDIMSLFGRVSERNTKLIAEKAIFKAQQQMVLNDMHRMRAENGILWRENQQYEAQLEEIKVARGGQNQMKFDEVRTEKLQGQLVFRSRN